jgi:hypothetical protein
MGETLCGWIIGSSDKADLVTQHKGENRIPHHAKTVKVLVDVEVADGTHALFEGQDLSFSFRCDFLR